MQAVLAFWLGAAAMPLPESLPDQHAAGYFGVRMTTDGNDVKLTEILADTPAERAGLQPGDVLRKIGEWTIDGDEPLREMIVTLRPGTRVPVVIKRGNEVVTVSVKIMPRP